MNNEIVILGAGITGLSAGINLGAEIFESQEIPGGLCASYCMSPDAKKHYSFGCGKSYRFELGGGHWIFGADKMIKDFINKFSITRTYLRNSAVYLPDFNLYVPFPLQNNLSYLPPPIKKDILREIRNPGHYKGIKTFEEWLEASFGNTLCKLFFSPFHDLYTAGLYKKIAPVYRYKTPFYKKLIIEGAGRKTPAVGYNASFIYPKEGLGELVRKLAGKCRIKFLKKAIKIDTSHKQVFFEDGTNVKYGKLISTLPLNKMINLTQCRIKEESLPYTSVLIVNIGAKRGERCPDYHWVYFPKSKAGFYRVGFYSNVDASFLPSSSRKKTERVSIYVEKAYCGGRRHNIDIKRICGKIVEELKSLRFITEVEVMDCNWVEVAYAWQYPDSNIKEEVIKVLKDNKIYQAGRYGRWRFQGIADSIREGLAT